MERKPRPDEVAGQLSPRLRAIALDAGVVNMKPPTWIPNSLKALQSIVHARDLGKAAEMRDALFVAHWEEGRNIGHVPVILEIAEAQGIEPGPLEEALGESRHLNTVMEEYQEGRDLGFEGIPAFVIGNTKFAGSQPMELFREAARRAQEMLDADPQTFSSERRVL